MTNNPIIPAAPRDNEREAIRNLQRWLRQLAEHDDRLILVPIDGIYESDTRAAVEAFQRVNRLPVTGSVDPVTWELLFAAYLASRARHDAPIAISPFPRHPPTYEIMAGEESELVGILHHMLRTLGQNDDDLAEIPDGLVFTGRTEHAVRALQGKHSITQTGRVDRLTWNAISEAYNRTVGQNQ